MFKRIVIGVDGEQGGRDAIALAHQLRPKGTRLVLATVHEGDEHARDDAEHAFVVAERQRAHDLLKAAREDAGIDADLVTFAASSVGRGLHLAAEHERADLLVVGSTRQALPGRVAAADDTQAALNGAGCAVAIAPAGYGEQPVVMHTIGVGYDGSHDSSHALMIAKLLAAEHDATTAAFEAVAIPGRALHGDVAAVTEIVKRHVDEARERLASLDVEAHAAYGAPAEQLALFSESVDLLVVGSRGYGPIGRFFHGSTSLPLARTSRCPLLVLTRGPA